MALKNLSVLESRVGSYSQEMQQDNPQPGLKARIFSNTVFDEPGTPFLEKQLLGLVQQKELQNDDYEIALVPRGNRTGRPQSIAQPYRTMDRVLLLSLTWRELLDRVHRERDQSGPVDRDMIERFGEVRVNFLTMEISRSGKPVVLTAQEIKLLRFFIKTPGRVFSRNQLLNEVWGYNNYPSTRTVDNRIYRLRQKLELAPARPVHFLTVHGLGYKFVP
jgi:hypothetical protein